MRVLKTLLVSILGIALLAGVGFLVGREILLQIGLSQVRSAVTQMRTVARQTGSYIQECRKKGPPPTTGDVIGSIQLRFTSSTQYQVEVICAQFQLSPIIVAEFSLPPYVTKVPGSTGMIWSAESTGGVSLSLWGRQRSVVIENQRFLRAKLPPPEERDQPVTTCAGNGYTCCQLESTLGSGDTVSNVLDCPRSCFASCQPRPLILALTSQPFYDQQSREVFIGNGEVMEFRYVIEVPNGAGVTVTLDFGDGVTETFTESTGGTSHTYRCATGVCRYQVGVTAVDAAGVTSAVTPISQVMVVVQ